MTIYVPTDIKPGDKVLVPDGRVGVAAFYAPWNEAAHFLIRFTQDEWFHRDDVKKLEEPKGG